MSGVRICLGLPGRPCHERTDRIGGRCASCSSELNRGRNYTRAQYRGRWKRVSIAARQNQPWCSICGTLADLTYDHEHGQVECRSCNSSHRRDA